MRRASAASAPSSSTTISISARCRGEAVAGAGDDAAAGGEAFQVFRQVAKAQQLQLAALQQRCQGLQHAHANGVGAAHHLHQRGHMLAFQVEGEVGLAAEACQQLADARRQPRGGQRVVEHVVGGEAFLGQQRVPRRQKKRPLRGVSSRVWKLGSISNWRMSAMKNSISSRASRRPRVSQLFTSKRVLMRGWRAMNSARASGTSAAGAGPQPKCSSPASSLVIWSISRARLLAPAPGAGRAAAPPGLPAWGAGPVAPVDQLAAEGLLQALDAAAEGRLGDAHGIGRADEAAVFHEGDEVTELAQVHHALPASKI